ncbi:PREDICTED: homeobox protein ATH1 [Prunus mume]|uniref:Homeobox protein ATH1 n=1 Tax=Prunus mume TaxID=102107 RepID=A0ABM0N6Z7_PRUMU|nr:PREDICTED: homeobox protein ATH1 [Prunus mume]
MMDNQMYNVPTDLTARNSVVMDGIVPHTTMNSLVQSYSFDLNHQNHGMALVPVLSSFPGEPVMHSHSEFNGTNGAGIVESNPFVTSQRRHNVRDSSFISSSFADNTVFEATPHSAASLATLLAAKGSLQENLNNLAISGTPVSSSEAYTSNDCSNNSNSLFATSMNCGYDEILGSISSQWEINKYAAPSELGERTSVRTGFQPFSPTGNLDPNGWLSSNGENVMTYHSYSSCKFSNELALTLATSSPAIVGGVDIRNQCSDIGSSGMAHPSLNQSRFGSSEQNSCNSEELSLSFGSYKPPQLSQVICGSRYLHVVQEILFDIASYSLENLDQSSFSSARIMSENADSDGRFEVHKDPALQKQEIKTKKSKLLTLLQMLDDCYNQCVDEIHTVVSAFHAATETDPHIHARFALQTISVLYKNLRERISTHFLAMTANSNPASPTESERSFEIHKQLALQHLKKKEHQIWRPQRGLPERSVSVLRAWMFQNFLHPYPKDAEKHVLAVKSGLTRNQVSNWFINARVRLWKPMIEEMYSEMNRRKTRQSDNTERNNRSHHHNISINHHKFGVN